MTAKFVTIKYIFHLLTSNFDVLIAIEHFLPGWLGIHSGVDWQETMNVQINVTLFTICYRTLLAV